MFEDESKRRRDILARRPSYRKILNDLSSAEATNNKGDKEQQATSTAIQLPTNINFKVLPSSIQIGGQDGVPTIQSIPTIMANNTPSTIVQYATSAHEGQFIVPGKIFMFDFLFCV